MARTALTVSRLAPNGSLAQPAGTAGTADGHFIDTNARTSVRDHVQAEQIVLHVTATAGSDVTIKAGDYPPALASGQGDLVVACGAGVTLIGPVESGRFQRNDGRIHVDYETASDVSVRAYLVPRSV